MPSLDGLEVLKNWHTAQSKVHVLPRSVGEIIPGEPLPTEVSVTVTLLAGSSMVLEICSSGRVVDFDMRNSELAVNKTASVLTVTIRTRDYTLALWEYL
jgi:hypothetical protein